MRTIPLYKGSKIKCFVETRSGSAGVEMVTEKNGIRQVVRMTQEEAWVLALQLLDDVRHAQKMELQIERMQKDSTPGYEPRLDG